MTGYFGRMMIVGWFGGILLLAGAIAMGKQNPANVLLAWTTSARAGSEWITLFDLRGGQSVAVPLSQSLPLAQQVQASACGANAHILQADSPTETFYNWHVSGRTGRTAIGYPANIEDSTARIGRRVVSPDGSWLFLPYDRLGIVVHQKSGDAFTLSAEEAPVSAGQPGYWSPDSRWLLWPYEVAGERVLWLYFDTQTGQHGRIETQGQATFIDDIRWGMWSPDSRHFATIRRYEDEAETPQAEMLILNPHNVEVRRFAFAGLANEMVWSPDGNGLLIFAAQSPGEDYLPGMLDVASGDIRILAQEGYPAPTLNQPAAYAPTWSTDGERMAIFTSDAPSQSAIITLHIVQADGTEEIAVPLPSRSRTPADAQFWEANSQQFALHDRARGVLLRIDLRSGEREEYGGGRQRIIAVLAEEDALILVKETNPGRSIQRLPWNSNAITTLRHISGTETTFTLCKPGA